MFLVAGRIQKPFSPEFPGLLAMLLSNIAREHQTREFVDLVGGFNPFEK